MTQFPHPGQLPVRAFAAEHPSRVPWVAASAAQSRRPAPPASALSASKSDKLPRHQQRPLRQRGPVQALPHSGDPEHPKYAERAPFLSRAACGEVECTSRGCRPVSKGAGGGPPTAQDERARASTDGWGRVLVADAQGEDAVPSEEAPGSWLAGGVQGSSEEVPLARLSDLLWHLPQGEQQFLIPAASCRHEDGRQAEDEPEGLLSLAEYSWREAGDLHAAHLLFQKVLKIDPANPTALASYALFLWECETAGHLPPPHADLKGCQQW